MVPGGGGKQHSPGEIHKENSKKPNQKISTMRTLFILALVVAAASAQKSKSKKKDDDGIGIKAASPFVNCGCQCSSVSFRDIDNQVHGNCKS